ncbi:hypothetical protein [Paenibacillus taichungensis]|uniref:hypothetical protein n=1 Tax=Paenibacillus taichungensis TaxID=484184 RepID=UPI0015C6272E
MKIQVKMLNIAVNAKSVSFFFVECDAVLHAGPQSRPYRVVSISSGKNKAGQRLQEKWLAVCAALLCAFFLSDPDQGLVLLSFSIHPLSLK